MRRHWQVLAGLECIAIVCMSPRTQSVFRSCHWPWRFSYRWCFGFWTVLKRRNTSWLEYSLFWVWSGRTLVGQSFGNRLMNTSAKVVFSHQFYLTWLTQLSNLRWMPNSISKGFDTAQRAHQDDSNDTPQPICECQVHFPLQWIKASWFILILSKGKVTWHSPIGCGVSFESSWWAYFHGTVKICDYWVWHSS